MNIIETVADLFWNSEQYLFTYSTRKKTNKTKNVQTKANKVEQKEQAFGVNSAGQKGHTKKFQYTEVDHVNNSFGMMRTDIVQDMNNDERIACDQHYPRIPHDRYLEAKKALAKNKTINEIAEIIGKKKSTAETTVRLIKKINPSFR